jgi:SAM-dependent methyltransferase
MTHKFKVYEKDTKYNLRYLRYQKKYRKNIRESDKKLIEKIKLLKKKKSRLLDIGCSTGNLLYHIKLAFKNFYLFGLDFETNVINLCKLDPELKNINFSVGSCLKMANLFREKFDIIILNAIVAHLNNNEFEKTIFEASKILSNGGSLMIFDYFNPFDQELEIIERSPYGSFEGIPLYYKSYNFTKKTLLRAGLKKIKFDPFHMPFDLKKNSHNLATYTINTNKRDRMSMRGSLFQPWCHVYATKI